MILLLSPDNDPVADALQKRLSTNASLLCVNPDQLVFAPVWMNEISENGASSTHIQLIDGQEIHSSEIKAAYNRIARLEAIHFLNEVDRNYADMEFTALYYSFIQSISHAMLFPFNISQMQMNHSNEWALKAAAVAAGLPVTDLELSSSPRWQKLGSMLPYETERNRIDGFYHQADHLVWENKPLRQQPKYLRVFSVFVSGENVFSEIELPFNSELLKLAAHFGSPYMEVKVAEQSAGAFCVYEYDIRPTRVHEPAIDALAKSLLMKSLQPA